ncbi:MAG: response regulator [Oligoflexales bacterium]|nr:response regulator [Oligoflexales bacterium]
MSQSQQKYDRTSFILVVDDDNTLLKFFKIHLNKFFSKVIVVKNAKEAIESLREKTIDLVISDINMPRIDGFQLMKRVRKHDTAIPVLLISGALLNKDEEDLLNEADGYLRKPFNVDQLHDFINNGLLRREKMKQLASLVSDKKQLRNLLKGTVKIEKVIKKDQQDEAKALLDEISQVA